MHNNVILYYTMYTVCILCTIYNTLNNIFYSVYKYSTQKTKGKKENKGKNKIGGDLYGYPIKKLIYMYNYIWPDDKVFIKIPYRPKYTVKNYYGDTFYT